MDFGGSLDVTASARQPDSNGQNNRASSRLTLGSSIADLGLTLLAPVAAHGGSALRDRAQGPQQRTGYGRRHRDPAVAVRRAAVAELHRDHDDARRVHDAGAGQRFSLQCAAAADRARAHDQIRGHCDRRGRLFARRSELDAQLGSRIEQQCRELVRARVGAAVRFARRPRLHRLRLHRRAAAAARPTSPLCSR